MDFIRNSFHLFSPRVGIFTPNRALARIYRAIFAQIPYFSTLLGTPHDLEKPYFPGEYTPQEDAQKLQKISIFLTFFG